MKKFCYRIRKIVSTLITPFRSFIRTEVDQALSTASFNIGRELQRRALQSTVDYVEKHMQHIDSVDSKWSLLSKCLQRADLESRLILEFGVFSGDTVNYIAENVPSSLKVYGFDSFEGLPERWRDGFGTGQFKMSQLPVVKNNVFLIKGFFDETLPDFLRIHGENVGFLHIDSDLYSSARTIFCLLKSRIKPGCVIVFDEYFNYPGWETGEFKAFMEFLDDTSYDYEYLSYNRLHEQVAVMIKEAASSRVGPKRMQ